MNGVMMLAAESPSTIPEAFRFAFAASHESAKGRSFTRWFEARRQIERIDVLRESLLAAPAKKPKPKRPRRRFPKRAA